MPNAISNKIIEKGSNVLNVYFTAGFPKLEDTATIIRSLADAGVDLVELGIPYSDPLADGTTIQNSSAQALKNGIQLETIFKQVIEARKDTDVPIIAMGYFNQMLQYGPESFLKDASQSGIDGLIIPDLPMDIYEEEFKDLFDTYQMGISFLITPMTSEERIKKADALSKGFIYMVSQSSITGKSGEISENQKEYFNRIKNMGLSTPRLIGFGIHNHETFKTACQYAHGAIIGSAFIRRLANSTNIEGDTHEFIQEIINVSQ